MSKNYLDYAGLSLYTEYLKSYISDTQPQIFCDTKANWDKQTTLVSTRGAIYIYTDYYDDDGTDIPSIKVGDGTSYLIDMPVLGKLYDDHLADTVSHITSAERTAWNDKVRCYLDNADTEKLVFTTN